MNYSATIIAGHM